MNPIRPQPSDLHEGLLEVVGFDAANVVGRCGTQCRHEETERITELNTNTPRVVTWIRK